MVCRLTPVAQLDGEKFQTINCGPASAAACIAFASCNAIVPTPNTMRAAGSMGNGWTDLSMLKRAIESFDDEFAKIGRVAPKMTRLGYIDRATLLGTLVRPELLHTVPIKYGVIASTQYASTGNFTGGHFVTATRIYVEAKSGGRFFYHRLRPHEVGDHDIDDMLTLVMGPLADGRFSGSLHRRVALAPELWPLTLLTKAADAMSAHKGMSIAVTPRAART